MLKYEHGDLQDDVSIGDVFTCSMSGSEVDDVIGHERAGAKLFESYNKFSSEKSLGNGACASIVGSSGIFKHFTPIPN